jgi:hypothetical protein
LKVTLREWRKIQIVLNEYVLTSGPPGLAATGIIGHPANLGHKLHIGTPYRGKHFLTRQIPTSCLPKSGGIIGEH